MFFFLSFLLNSKFYRGYFASDLFRLVFRVVSKQIYTLSFPIDGIISIHISSLGWAQTAGRVSSNERQRNAFILLKEREGAEQGWQPTGAMHLNVWCCHENRRD